MLVLACRISLGFYGLNLHRWLLGHSCDVQFLSALHMYSFVLVVAMISLFFCVLVLWYLDAFFDPDESKYLIATLVTFIGKDAAPCSDSSLLRTTELYVLSLGLLEPAAIDMHLVALQHALPPEIKQTRDPNRVIIDA